MPCSPQELLTESARFADLPPGMRAIIKTALLCRINDILNPPEPPIDDMQVYHAAFADPNGNVMPTDGQIANLYYQDGAVTNLWKWSVADQNWTQIIVSKKVYRALLNQADTAAPTVTLLENTVGDIVWSRNAAGEYSATLSGAFAQAKTFPNVQAFYSSSPSENIRFLFIFRTSDSILTLNTLIADVDGAWNGVAYADNVLRDTPVEILVYP